MKELPLFDASEPIVCTIDESEQQARIELVERMRAALESIERTDAGLVLAFDPELEADVRRFAVDEKRCCRFWGFDVQRADERATLRWEGPPAARDLLDRLERFFKGEGSASAFAGLF